VPSANIRLSDEKPLFDVRSTVSGTGRLYVTGVAFFVVMVLYSDYTLADRRAYYVQIILENANHVVIVIVVFPRSLNHFNSFVTWNYDHFSFSVAVTDICDCATTFLPFCTFSLSSDKLPILV